jgi:hypothetical protein
LNRLVVFFITAFFAAAPHPGLAAGLPEMHSAKAAESRLETYFRTELYFGLKKSDGTEVSDAEWSAFLAEEVTALFPEGFTVLSAAGQYRSNSGEIVREPSRMLVIVYGKRARRSADQKIEQIRSIYKERFKQESVMRVDITHSVRVSF